MTSNKPQYLLEKHYDKINLFSKKHLRIFSQLSHDFFNGSPIDIGMPSTWRIYPRLSPRTQSPPSLPSFLACIGGLFMVPPWLGARGESRGQMRHVDGMPISIGEPLKKSWDNCDFFKKTVTKVTMLRFIQQKDKYVPIS